MDQLVNAAQGFGAVAAILVALGVIGRAALGVYRLAKRIESTNDLVHHELQPNSGSSLRDAVDRVEATLEAVSERTTEIEKRVDVLDRRSGDRRTSDDPGV